MYGRSRIYMIRKFISTDESELTFTPDGVKVANGMLWFDLICMDPACEEAEFLITEINNWRSYVYLNLQKLNKP